MGILSDSSCCSEPVSYAAVEEDGTSGLVIDVFDDSDKVGAEFILLHGCPQAARHAPLKAFLVSMKTWSRSCWCWRYFSQRILRLKICSVVLFPALKPAFSLSNELLYLLLQSACSEGASDTEIKVPSVEDTELKSSPFKAWSRSV